jgi:predicted CopG family antitoxin
MGLKKRGGNTMSTLTIRILEKHKDSLSDAAMRTGLTRMEGGELTGNISMLINLLAQALPHKSEAEIREFLMSRGEKGVQEQ